MALDATVGSPDSNSYVTVAEANSYFSDRSHSEEWDDFDEQASALITSSSMLDWYLKWKGYKTSSEQAMQWPRTGVVRKDGTSVEVDIIPRDVKVAVYELTLSSLEEDRTADSALAGIDQAKAGSLMIKAETKGYPSSAPSTIPDKIEKILSDLISTGGISVVRLMRA
jgi:hypothetical protein